MQVVRVTPLPLYPWKRYGVAQLNMKVVGRHSLSGSFEKHKNYFPFLGIGPIFP
jgi:hypothetical protein